MAIPKGQEKLHRLLEFVWVRLQERFKNFSPAFRFFDLNFNNRVSFNEFQFGMENLKVKLSSRDQQLIFNFLDKDHKGYISYEDFTTLSPERRAGTDPAAAMIKEYKETGELSYNFGKKPAKSPSRAHAHRQKDMLSNEGGGTTTEGASMAGASMTSNDKSEFMKYLDALDIEDLEMITKDRKSTKKYEDGPLIYGSKSPFGQAKVGKSIPKHLVGNPEHEFGLGSYHRGHASELKKLLSNEIFRE